METCEDYLPRLASVLDDIGTPAGDNSGPVYRHAFEVRSQLRRPKSSPALTAARFVATGLSNKACSPDHVPPADGFSLALSLVLGQFALDGRLIGFRYCGFSHTPIRRCLTDPCRFRKVRAVPRLGHNRA